MVLHYNRQEDTIPCKTIMDADYVDDIALLANTPTQAKSQLHDLEQAAGGIGLHIIANKMEYMCFNQKGNISKLSEISGHVYLPWKQHLIDWKWHQCMINKGMDCYQLVVNHMEVKPIR